MRILVRAALLSTALLLVLPSVADAARLRTVTREQSVSPGTHVLRGGAPGPFTLAGVSWRGSGAVSFRTRSLAGRWSAWRPAAPEPGDLPDAAAGGWRVGNPWWTGPSDRIEHRVRGAVRRLRSTFVWSEVPAIPLRTLTLADAPAIVLRSAWAGSPDRLRRGKPRYADALRFAIVHHTAGSGSYTRTQAPAVVRAVAAYHVLSNGWDDVGYNFLVDRFGTVYEGRYGGMERNVVGAHAQGFNAGSVGIALMGTYSSAGPTKAARDSLARLLAWRLDLAHVDPLSMVNVASGGNPRYREGVPVLLRAVSGHRDTHFTSCPGRQLYALLPGIAQAVAATGLPKLYAPAVHGAPGGIVRFTARMSGALPWTVTVTDEAGGIVALGSGTGPVIDWTWDARAAAPGRYVWAIDGGPTVRPATGSFTGGAAGVTLTATARPTTISPDGDGRADATAIAYRLGRIATVSVVVLDATGVVVATLASGPQAAGAYTLSWAADGLADGTYSVLLSAQAGGRTATATLTVMVNRTLSGLSVSPAFFSPNGDGRRDTLSLAFTLAVPADASVEARRRGSPPLPIAVSARPAGRHSLLWNGEAAPGAPVLDGSYALVVRATNAIGSVAQSASVVLDTVAPSLRLVSRNPLRVRVTEPGMLRLTLDGAPAEVRVAKAGVVRLSIAGSRVAALAEDRAGNRSTSLRLR
ncbi:MAG: FlgD immunoglobulin-like domain containing protein [Gaiellaceae bacterium]